MKRKRITRRTMLESLAAAAALPLAGSCQSAAHATQPLTESAAAVPLAGGAPRRVLKVGLVGCGGRGSGAAHDALRCTDGAVVLTAMADLFQDRLAQSHAQLVQALGAEHAERLQVPEERRFVGFDAYRRLMDTDVDIVLLATPPVFRPEHLALAIEKKKHVFAEKPVAVDGPGVRAVLASAAAARAQGLSIVSGFCWRYNAAHRATYARIRDGALGELQAVYGTYNAVPNASHSREPGWSDTEWMLRNWHHFHELSGDHVAEQAVHTLDKIAWAFGDVPPLSVVATGGCQTRSGPEKGNTFDHFSATFDYPGGAKAFLMCRQMPNTATENNDYLFGTRGRCRIENWTPLHVIEGEEPWEYTGPGNDMYQAELDALCAAIRAGVPVNDGEWMATSTLLAIMVRMAAYTGEVVTWQQALESEERLARAEWELGPATCRPLAIPGAARPS